MEHAQFSRLTDLYADYASWAIWDPTNRKNVDIIRASLPALHARTVMVGLNVSATLPVAWSNFHIGRNDAKLEHAFNTGKYRGSYLTDLIKGVVESKSVKLMTRILRGEIDVKAHAASFKQEMFDVGANDSTFFLLFGGDVTKLFREHLATKFPNFVSVRHPASRGFAQAWIDETLGQLG